MVVSINKGTRIMENQEEHQVENEMATIYTCGLTKGHMVVCWGPPKNPYYGDFMLNNFHFGPRGSGN